ncbi:AcrR family transcriptional regulator [Arcanobacterium wilhelmae]|uniref:AcrR family transcriptional regulator n=1 Tax=Arcanobacterium wilhelmae TaxID=1803177 RepID=A0ABT9NCL8_9ACTO|nr:TetR/AcrR family transcriptional regulator [Arcanobacterium wilhelmae]MDP9801460.1 AcrR family transcriptional regulator [Arcanobacterium wilhelmae]WFN90791.1 TetR/AcrR family transcriptional regulator [Arcanobacterium wilhelmae]
MGKREERKRDDHAKILTAARELMQRDGFDTVTTEQLAAAAGVSTGTLFRQIGCKADLLIELFLISLKDRELPDGEIASLDDAVAQVIAVVDPFVAISTSRPDNAIALQREVIGGSSPRVREFISYVQSFEASIGAALTRARKAGVLNISDDDVVPLAHAIYGSLYMDFLQVSTGRVQMEALRETMVASVRFILERL